jgi:hypothetical protein
VLTFWWVGCDSSKLRQHSLANHHQSVVRSHLLQDVPAMCLGYWGGLQQVCAFVSNQQTAAGQHAMQAARIYTKGSQAAVVSVPQDMLSACGAPVI